MPTTQKIMVIRTVGRSNDLWSDDECTKNVFENFLDATNKTHPPNFVHLDQVLTRSWYLETEKE